MKASHLALALLPMTGGLLIAACGGSDVGEFTVAPSDAGLDGVDHASPTTIAESSTPNTNDVGTAPPFDSGSQDASLGAPDGPDGAIAPTPTSPPVASGCDALCAKEATANCPNQGTVSGCSVGCRLLLSKAECQTDTDALFACEKTSAVACDPQGKATLTSCTAEQLGALACFLRSADPSLVAPCQSYCAAVAAANCPKDDLASCQSGCPLFGNLVAGCNAFWRQYVTCANTATLTCGTDGKASAKSCAASAAAYLLCTLNGINAAADAGG